MTSASTSGRDNARWAIAMVLCCPVPNSLKSLTGRFTFARPLCDAREQAVQDLPALDPVPCRNSLRGADQQAAGPQPQ